MDVVGKKVTSQQSKKPDQEALKDYPRPNYSANYADILNLARQNQNISRELNMPISTDYPTLNP